MRTALLSALEQTEDGTLRAFLTLGGRSLLQWQAELAEEMGCTRLVCLCEGTSPQLIELQQDAESRGIRLHLIRGPLQLVSLLSADDSILVMADGLLPDRGLAMRLFGEGRGVATLPADAGIAAGFERIDVANAWGGILVARANIAEKLAEMPPDSDTVSLLLRLALQSGCRTVALDTNWLHSGEWLLVREQDELQAREKALLDTFLPAAVWTGPGKGLARQLARKLAPGQLGKGPMVASAISLVSTLSALAAATQGYVSSAVALMGLSFFAFTTAGFLRSLKFGLFQGEPSKRLSGWGKIALDVALIAILTLPSSMQDITSKSFLPIMAIGLVRVAEKTISLHWSALWSDRTMLCVVLLLGASFGLLPQTLSGIALSALAFLLFPRKNDPLTAD